MSKDTKERLYTRAMKYKRKNCQSIKRTKRTMKDYLEKNNISTKDMSMVEMKKQTKQVYNKRCPALSKMNKAQLKRFTDQYAPVKRVAFRDSVKKIPRQIVKPPKLSLSKLETPTRKIMAERMAILKGIGSRKETSRKIAKILYRKIPTQQKYVEIMIYNKHKDAKIKSGKALKKKEPMRVVKIKGKSKHIMPTFRMKYTVTQDKDNGKIVAKVGGHQKTFRYNIKERKDRYGAEYKAKLFIIEEYRKIFEKRNIA